MQPVLALGDVARIPFGYNRGGAWDLRLCHARPNSRLVAIARTRQVTVNSIICGVDVSKNWLDAHVAAGPGERGEACRFANDADGIGALAAFCAGHGAELAVREASGGLERQAYLLLWQLGQPCALANARHVRAFAEAMGFAEKTDRIDAMVIARFALAKGIVAEPPPGPQSQRLQALVARLGQVIGDLTVNKQRRASARNAEMGDSLDELIAFLNRQKRSLTGEIASMIDDDPLWARLDQAIRSFKGLAGRSVGLLLAQLPQIGLVSNKAIAKLAGLAPIADDSGARHGQRHVRGGRAPVRSLLFLVADIARRYDPDLGAFHAKLSAAGKPKMVVRTALARKLLVRLNARARIARAEIINAT